MTSEKIDRKGKAKLPPQMIPIRPANERIFDFEAVKLSFDEQAAIAEASRCISCPKQPCVSACPLGNDIPAAVRLISEGQFEAAAEIYELTSTMPEVCARVCPQDNLCEGACVLGKRGTAVALGALEKFVADYVREHRPKPTPKPTTGKSVAIVGAGPSGLSAAQRLLEQGHSVTVYEAWPSAGGWLTYAIPTYKLPREVVQSRVAYIEALGGVFKYNTRVGENISLEELRSQYDAVYIGVGAMIDAQVEIEGRDLPGVYSGTEFLLPVYVSEQSRPPQMEPPTVGPRVVVFGGGDTAMDCVRTAVRLQAQQGMEPDVTLIYRRTAEEMPASHRERKHAKEEGIEFVYLAAPVAFHTGPDNRLRAVTVQRMELGEPDSSGRRRPVPIEGDTYTVDADAAVLALGYWPDPLISKSAPDLESHNWGLITIDDESKATNLAGVYAGGDAVRGPDLVSRAVRDGMAAARSIHEMLMR